MDVSRSSLFANRTLDDPLRSSYISCIVINGNPILPPVMTESKRAEMRKYREQAVMVEEEFKRRTPFRNCDSPSPKTSTPKKDQVRAEFDPNTAKQEKHNAEEEETNSNQSEELFASLGSSHKTFVFKDDLKENPEKKEKIEEVAILNEKQEETVNNTETKSPEIQKSISADELLTPIYKRKRPKLYFDEDVERSSFSENLSRQLRMCHVVSRNNTSPTVLESILPNACTDHLSEHSNSESHSAKLPPSGVNVLGNISPNLNYSKPENEDKGTFQISEMVPGQLVPEPKPEEQTTVSAKKHEESDKENRNENSPISNARPTATGRKHIRKSSYTVLFPSEALIAASEGSTSQSIDPASSSSCTYSQDMANSECPSSRGIDISCFKAVDSLKDLDETLDYGKKIQLEKFLSPDNSFQCEKLTEKMSPLNTSNSEAIDKLRSEEEKELNELRKAYFDMKKQLKKKYFEKMLSIVQNDSVVEENRSEHCSIGDSSGISKQVLKSSKEASSETNSTLVGSISHHSKTPTFHGTSTCGVGDINAACDQQIHSNGYDNSICHTASSSLPQTSRSISVGAVSSVPSATSAPSESHMPTESLSKVGLSKLQTKILMMDPNLLRQVSEVRSPLLKGVLFHQPLAQSRGPLRIPPLALDASMKPKFDKISAAVKGYLTRRLLHTEKIQEKIIMIKDTVELTLNLYEEGKKVGEEIKPEDIDLHKRLLQQLTGACSAFYDIFFTLTTAERMAIIATDREKLKAKALRNVLSRERNVSKRNVSSATLKSMERRISQYHRFEKGSQSVKPKGITSYTASQKFKKRRMSCIDVDRPGAFRDGDLGQPQTKSRNRSVGARRGFKNSSVPLGGRLSTATGSENLGVTYVKSQGSRKSFGKNRKPWK